MLRGYITKQSAPDWIVIKAIDKQKSVVGQVSAADTRLNVQEGRGQVLLDNRSVTVAIPLIKLPEQLAVAMPDAPDSLAILDVDETSKVYCKKYPQSDICQPREIEQDSRFMLWNRPDQVSIANPLEQ